MEQLCLSVQPGAYAFLLSMLRNPEDAADALQESLLRLVRFLPSLRDPASLPAWFMRLLANQAQTSRRRHPAAIIDVAADADDVGAGDPVAASTAPHSPRAFAQITELSRLINRAIAELPHRQKMALVLFEQEHLTIREVAAVMELTDGAVKFHLHEARKHLRARLEELGVDAGEIPAREVAR